MRKLFGSKSRLFSAFADADLTNLATILAQGEDKRPRIPRASFTRFPLTRLIMGLSLVVEAPTWLAIALTAGISLLSSPSNNAGSAVGPGYVAPEGAGGGELP